MRFLPYRYQTPNGESLSFEFRLHDETGSAMRVHQLLDRILTTVNQEVGVLGETRNGDLLQALAMALAVRTRLIPADPALTHQLALQLAEQALESLDQASLRGPAVGHA
jgi:hypothetical protein